MLFKKLLETISVTDLNKNKIKTVPSSWDLLSSFSYGKFPQCPPPSTIHFKERTDRSYNSSRKHVLDKQNPLTTSNFVKGKRTSKEN